MVDGKQREACIFQRNSVIIAGCKPYAPLPGWRWPGSRFSISIAHAGRRTTFPKSLNVKGGFVVHLGCGDGKLTLTLRPNSRFQVHGLDANPANVAKARATVRRRRVYGPVSIDRLRGQRGCRTLTAW